MFEVIILAGGYSSRMGSNKMELEIQGKPVLLWTIDVFRHRCDRILVIGGHYYHTIKDMLKDDEKVSVLYNKDYHKGMFSSVMCGIREVSHSCFICPGDYPLLKASTIDALAEAQGEFIVPVYEGKRGHPVLLSESAVTRLKKQALDSNLKAFRDTCRMTEVPVHDESILWDMDHQEDYHKLKRRKEGVV